VSLFDFKLNDFQQMMSGGSTIESVSPEDDSLKRSRLFTYIAAFISEFSGLSFHILKTKQDKLITKIAYAKYVRLLRENILKEIKSEATIDTISPIFKLYFMLGGHFLMYLEMSHLLDNLSHIDIISSDKGTYAQVRTKYKVPNDDDKAYIFMSMSEVKIISFLDRISDNYNVEELKKATQLSNEDFDDFVRISVATFAYCFYSKSIADVAAIDEWIVKHNLTNQSSYEEIRKAVG
jgi:hypothetical protein